MTIRGLMVALVLTALMTACGDTESPESDAAPTASPSEVAEKEAVSTSPSAVAGDRGEHP